MKSLKFFLLFLVVQTGCWMPQPEASSQQGSVSFQVFYDELTPYGNWVDNPDFGYVWIPARDEGFAPYASGGHWVYTEDGWTWVSDYPWGWATFHYGRWDFDAEYGWFWVPGEEWGPAWVSWRRSPGYYGWAPLRPGISIDVAFGRNYQERNDRWVFVREGDVTRPDVSRQYLSRRGNETLINGSTVIVNVRKDARRNITYVAGPERDEVQMVTRAPVRSIVIRENDRPGGHLNNDELQIYRPQFQRKAGDARTPAPANVRPLHDVQPVPRRDAVRPPQEALPPPVIRKDERPEQHIAPPVAPRKDMPPHDSTPPARAPEVQPVRPLPAQPAPVVRKPADEKQKDRKQPKEKSKQKQKEKKKEDKKPDEKKQRDN
jgi:hypothetical protein